MPPNVNREVTVFRVSARGDDGHAGTREAPFRTLQRAQRAVREEIARGLRGPVRVELGSDICLSEPLVFGPQDSGTAGCPITWTGTEEGGLIYGGRRITGWARQEGDLWAAYVPWAKDRPFRQLYVQTYRQTLARTPNADAEPPYMQVALSELSPDLKSFRLGFGAGKPAALARPSEVEVVTLGNWEICRRRAEGFDPATGALSLAGPNVPEKSAPWNWPSVGRWGFLEGAREFLDQAGEWYLDREAGMVYYLAPHGMDVNEPWIVAPVLPRLLEIRGTREQPVRYLNFRVLGLGYTAWSTPPGGYYGVQACHYVTGSPGGQGNWLEAEAAVRWEWAERCTMDHVQIVSVGGSGLYLGEGCRDCEVTLSKVRGAGGNGIMVGGPNDPEKVVRGNRIAENVVSDCGVELYGAVGIWVGLAAKTTVAHNEVYDLPYSGISVGWQWNPEPTVCRENVIEGNHIYRVMQKLADGGGIYTLGFQPGTVLRGNLIHDIQRSRYAQGAPNNGFFIDEGSKGFLFEANTVYNVADQPVRHNANQPDWHTWKDNSFGQQPEPGTPAAKAAEQAGPLY